MAEGRVSASVFNEAVDLAPWPTLIVDPESVVVYANAAAATLLAARTGPSELIGRALADFTVGDPDRIRVDVKTAASSGRLFIVLPMEDASTPPRKDAVRRVAFRAARLRGEASGQGATLLSADPTASPRRAFVEMSEEQRRDNERAALADGQRAILEAATCGIVGVLPDRTVISINASARRIFGDLSAEPPFAWPDHLRFFDRDTLEPLRREAHPLEQALRGAALDAALYLIRTSPDAPARHVRLSSASTRSPNGVVLIIDDVSEQERNRQIVDRASRLEALGQLTGGIAHEFNNILATLLYAVELARDEPSPEVADDHLTSALRSINRATALTGRLLSFAQAQPGVAQSRAVAAAFDEARDHCAGLISGPLHLESIVEPRTLQVHCVQPQLVTALGHLVRNAVEAIRRSGVGDHVVLRARPATAEAWRNAENPMVEISVADNGPGMDDEVRRRAVDPFFTTKDDRTGSGLGLSVVYGFARQAAGELRVVSKEGAGTTVRLLLPRGAAPEAAAPLEVERSGREKES